MGNSMRSKGNINQKSGTASSGQKVSGAQTGMKGGAGVMKPTQGGKKK